MGFERTLPPPVYGVSTIEPAARPEGFCTEQVNWRNDLQKKLTRRPKTRALPEQLPVSQINPSTTLTKVVPKDGVRQEIVVNVNETTGTIETYTRTGYAAFVRHELAVGTWASNSNGKLGANLVDGEWFIWNKGNVIDVEQKEETSLALTKRVSLLNVTSALNYAEEVVVELTDGTDDLTVTYTVPGLTADNQEAADAARATNVVATSIAAQINTGVGLFSANVQGSNVFITTSADVSSITAKVSSGRGDSTILAFNYTLTSVDFLPKYSKIDVVREVAPDPNSSKGRFYLQAVAVDENDTSTLPEVVWTETFSPTDSFKFTADSFVVRLRAGSDLERFEFKEQLVGDSVSNKPLDLIGKAIEHMELFQDRLLMLAGNRLTVSKTDDFQQLWKSSALETLVTDPTSVGTSGNSSKLEHAVFHNRDLLVFASDATFKLDGSTALTPQTASLPKTTSNESNLNVAPVQMGAYVYYANNYGSSVGIRRFEVQADTTVDTSVSITDHIIGYMPGGATALVSNANQDMLIVRSSQSNNTEFFVFEQQQMGDQVVNSWTRWKLADGILIDHIDLFNERITVRHNGRHYITCELKDDEVYPVRDICLDLMLELRGEGNLLKVPDWWYRASFNEPVIMISSEGRRDTLAVLNSTYVETTGGYHVFDLHENMDNVPLSIGYAYESCYTPTRPYERDRQGNIRTSDRLRISYYMLELSNTYEMTREIAAVHWDIPDEVFTSLSANTTEYIDEVNPYTGQWQAQIGMNAADAEVSFKVTRPYAATIVAMSYKGQQFSTRSRR